MIAGGVSLGQAGLVNSGRLIIGDNGPGQVSVDRFSSDSDATLSVSVGGLAPGTELSRLIVTAGTAQLDGALAPTLFDDGGGLFAPSLDDVFTIITAPGGIVGQFDSVIQPLGMPTGLLFEVQYTANSVSLFIDTTYAADFDRDGDVDNVDYGIWRCRVWPEQLWRRQRRQPHQRGRLRRAGAINTAWDFRWRWAAPSPSRPHSHSPRSHS